MQITHQRILNIAIPIVLANVTVPLLSLVDTGVVGQIDSPIPIAAVGMGGLILNTTYWFFGFLRMGTTGLASQEREVLSPRATLTPRIAQATLNSYEIRDL